MAGQKKSPNRAIARTPSSRGIRKREARLLFQERYQKNSISSNRNKLRYKPQSEKEIS